MSVIKNLVISELFPALNVKVIKTNDELGLLEDYFGRVTEFGFDTETNFVNTIFERKARTFQFGDRNEQYVVDLLGLAGSTEELVKQGNKRTPKWAKEFARVVRIGLESDKHLKLGFNLQFDYEVSRWCLGLRPFNFYDCLLAEKVLNTGRVRFDNKTFWAMSDVVRRYCLLNIDKTEQTKFNLTDELTQEQIDYAALDSRLVFSIRNGQNPIIDNTGVRHTIEVVENPAIPAFGDMHISGFGVSTELWIKQVKIVEEKVKKDVALLDAEFIPVVGKKGPPDAELLLKLEKFWRDEKDKIFRKQRRIDYQEYRKKFTEWKKLSVGYQGEAAINYGSWAQLIKAFKKMGIELPDTNDDTLKAYNLKKPNNAIKALRTYRSDDKLLDTYGYGFLEQHVNPYTGRIHSNIKQLGADSGRTSSSNPNTQNLPQESDKDNIHYRSCFVARKGWKIITRDYDGCELRIIAELSGEESWIDAFNAGFDVHSICSELIFGDDWKNGAEEGCAYYSSKQKCECKKHKELRNAVKAVSFGLAYGAEAANLSEQLGISKEAAQRVLDLHRKTFPKIHAMLAKVAQDAIRTLEVRTIGGRRRLFTRPEFDLAKDRVKKFFIEDGKDPKTVTTRDIMRQMGMMKGNIEREAKNTPFQGTNADMAKVAMAYIWPRLEPEFGAEFVNMVHDELVIECPEETAEACDKFVGEMMELAGTLYIKTMRMTSGGNIDDCWSK